jgi:hypothetical protein
MKGQVMIAAWYDRQGAPAAHELIESGNALGRVLVALP